MKCKNLGEGGWQNIEIRFALSALRIKFATGRTCGSGISEQLKPEKLAPPQLKPLTTEQLVVVILHQKLIDQLLKELAELKLTLKPNT